MITLHEGRPRHAEPGSQVLHLGRDGHVRSTTPEERTSLIAGAYFFHGNEATGTPIDSWAWADPSRRPPSEADDVVVHLGNGDIWTRSQAGAWTLAGNLHLEAQDIAGIQQFSASWSVNLAGVTGQATYRIFGGLAVESAGETGDYTTDFGARGARVYLRVNTIVGGGAAVITGTSLDDQGRPQAADSENIVIDTTAGQHYRTTKRWLEVTNVDVSALTTVDYDVGVVSVMDFGSLDFTVRGVVVEFLTGGGSDNCGIIIERLRAGAGNKFDIVEIEDLGFASTPGGGQIADGVRTGPDSRAFTAGANLAATGTTVTLRATDYETFFTAGENDVAGATANEGLIARFVGVGGNLNVDHALVQFLCSAALGLP